ncbi:MAG: hypothetical protein O7D33_08915 [Chloroflexi bacterium]|nr:hypothetical protein [Chloroflexota bacterium]
MRPAHYALAPGSWRDYVTILHPPYTLWHLSYVVIGAAVSPTLHLDRLGSALLAFFLAVGIGAHALDELKGRPLRTEIPDRILIAAAVVSIGVAVALGIIGSIAIDPWLLVFTGTGGFIVVAYNLELFGGRFHTDFWFAAAWGAFPMLTAYWANAGSFTVLAGIVAVLCYLSSAAQRALSSRVRRLRRQGHSAGTGAVIAGSDEIKAALAVPERTLQALNLTVVLAAALALLLRL